MCPVGYHVDQHSDVADKCYILVADVSGAKPTFHCLSWHSIHTDISLLFPNYFNVRYLKDGIMKKKKKTKKSIANGNNHCIIQFEKIDHSEEQ